MQSVINHDFHRRRGLAQEDILCVLLFVALGFMLGITHYREKRMRSITSRIHRDLTSISAALDVYRIDRGAYPPYVVSGTLTPLNCITTPIAYLRSLPLDPYANPSNFIAYYQYISINSSSPANTAKYLQIFADQLGYIGQPAYMVSSLGPSRQPSNYVLYDPTNGASVGRIAFLGP